MFFLFANFLNKIAKPQQIIATNIDASANIEYSGIIQALAFSEYTNIKKINPNFLNIPP